VPSGKTGNNFIAELPATQTYIPQSRRRGFLRGRHREIPDRRHPIAKQFLSSTKMASRKKQLFFAAEARARAILCDSVRYDNVGDMEISGCQDPIRICPVVP
jgi:hypothetical protein